MNDEDKREQWWAASDNGPAASGADAPTTHIDCLLRESGFSSAEDNLEGHTMSDAIIYGDGLRDAKGMIRFFIQHKTNKKLLTDAVEGWFEGRPGSQWRRPGSQWRRRTYDPTYAQGVIRFFCTTQNQ